MLGFPRILILEEHFFDSFLSEMKFGQVPWEFLLDLSSKKELIQCYTKKKINKKLNIYKSCIIHNL